MKFAALVAEADKGQLAEMVKLSKTSLLVVPDGGSNVERTKVLVRAEVNCTLTSKPQDSLSTASRFLSAEGNRGQRVRRDELDFNVPVNGVHVTGREAEVGAALVRQAGETLRINRRSAVIVAKRVVEHLNAVDVDVEEIPGAAVSAVPGINRIKFKADGVSLAGNEVGEGERFVVLPKRPKNRVNPKVSLLLMLGSIHSGPAPASKSVKYGALAPAILEHFPEAPALYNPATSASLKARP